MNITSARFIKGVVGDDELLKDGKPQVALIGRSNVGKSSVINVVTNQKALAKTSSYPGRTKEINVFLVNNTLYLMDLPGYGFAKDSWTEKARLEALIYWYLLNSPYEQKKVILIIDASVGPTERDLEMLYSLVEQKKNVVVVANKVDKIKKSAYVAQLQKIKEMVGSCRVLPFSTVKKIGVSELVKEILE
ncbi:MAG: ribosome biogenesis GTP-binding protein YihA/YsxC [Patescibacteria group bacterium]